MWEHWIRALPIPIIVYFPTAMAIAVAVAMVISRIPPVGTDGASSGGKVSDLAAYDSSHSERTQSSGQHAATTRTAREQLDQEFAKVGGRLDELKAEIESLNQSQRSLKGDQLGRQVASSEISVSRMRALDRFLNENQQDIAKIESEYGRLVADSMSVNSSETGPIRRDLAAFESKLASVLQDISNCRLAIAAIVADCDRLPFADKTLAEKLVELEQAEQVQFADALRRAQEEAEAQSQTLLREAEQKKRQAESDLAASKLQLEAVKVRDKEADQYIARIKTEAQAKAAQEAARLEADFIRDLPRIQYYLAPLLAHGRSQPDFGGNHTYSDTIGPVSLTAIRRAGGMQEGDEGLYNLASAMSYNNDRGRFSVPDLIDGRANGELRAYIVPARKLLEKYQFLLVKKGMLAE